MKVTFKNQPDGRTHIVEIGGEPTSFTIVKRTSEGRCIGYVVHDRRNVFGVPVCATHVGWSYPWQTALKMAKDYATVAAIAEHRGLS